MVVNTDGILTKDFSIEFVMVVEQLVQVGDIV